LFFCFDYKDLLMDCYVKEFMKGFCYKSSQKPVDNILGTFVGVKIVPHING